MARMWWSYIAFLAHLEGVQQQGQQQVQAPVTSTGWPQIPVWVFIPAKQQLKPVVAFAVKQHLSPR
eukprot:3679383-Amphidinium_carterae.1